jgi:hypothetical protein
MRKAVVAIALILALLLSMVVGTLLVNLGSANPIGPPEIVSVDGSPDSKTQPPTVSMTSPTNCTSYPLNSVSLTYNVSIGDSSTASVRFIWEITFEADWLPNNITAYEFNADKTESTITQFSNTLDLTGIPEGTHNLVIHARERGAYERNDYISGFITKVYVTNFFIDGSSWLT